MTATSAATRAPLLDRIAGAPISWGVCEVAGWGHQLESALVLAQMRELGLAATEFGPDGFLPDAPDAKAAALSDLGLRAVGQFVPVILHDPTIDPLPAVEAAMEGLVAAQASTVVIAAATGVDGYDARPDLDDEQWTTLLGNLDRIADAAAARGLAAALHPHVGTLVESGSEAERVLAGSRIDLCLDTGHLLIGGGDPVALARQWPRRISHVHLKDVRLDLAWAVQAGRSTYTEAVAKGMYVPLGEGDVDITAIVSALEGAGYAGWYVLEQDTILTGSPAETGVDPAADVVASMTHLRGIAEALETGPGPASAPGTESDATPAPTSEVTRDDGELTAYEGFDLVAMGRTGVDIYPLQHGVGLEDVRTFEKFLGGSATNVAVAAAQHGHRVTLVTKVGRDPFGSYVQRESERLGVDPGNISVLGGEGPPTPVTFCEVFPPDDFPLWFYRYPVAPDLLLTPDDLPLDDVRSAGVFWSTVTGLSQEPSRATHFAAWAARGRRRHTVLDLDYRPMFWESGDAASEQVGRALDHVTIAVGNREECEIAVGESEPDRAADALLERGLDLAIVKQGPGGVLAATADERVEVAPFPVDVVNGLGAGDGFGGALVHGLLEGWDLRRTVEFANVAGALVAGRLECSTAMPTTVEVETAMARAGRQ